MSKDTGTTFTHNKVTYTVHPRTVFQKSLLSALIADVGAVIVKGLGYDSTSDESIPYITHALITRFVHWLQVTSNDGSLYDVDLYANSENLLDVYSQWRHDVTRDSELAEKWQTAYDNAQGTSADPLADSAR